MTQLPLEVETRPCAICGESAQGRYCAAHDPRTAEIPFALPEDAQEDGEA